MLRPIRIRNYLSIMHARGFSTEQVLSGTGISSLKLQNRDYLISPRQCQVMIANMIRLSGDPGLGFEAGRSTELVTMGIVGYAMLTSRVMRQTLEVWDHYAESLVGIMSRISFRDSGDGDIALTIVSPEPTNPIHIFCAEEILSMVYKTGTLLSGVSPDVVQIQFSYPAPAHRHLYKQLFQCPIRFDAESTCAIYARDWLNLPLVGVDDELNELCLQHCERVFHQIEHNRPVTGRLRKLFLNDPRLILSLDEAAQKLDISARTLRRRLQSENLNYQTLVREFRADLAREYLDSEQMAPKKVAHLLGFDNVHSFRRAFKTWTGQTVTDYRASTLKKSK